MLLIGAAVGALVCGLPYLLYGGDFPPFIVTWVALTVAAAGMAIWRPSASWRAGKGVGIGLLVVIAVQIVVGVRQDPASHNLWPLEIVIALAFGMPPALLGAFLGGLTSRKAPRPAMTGAALLMLALALAGGSAAATAVELTRIETFTLKRVGALIAAQYRFRAAHPHRGFTCNLGELGEPFPGPIQRNPAADGYRVERIYRDGTYAIDRGYRYSLRCERKPDPRKLFILTASPTATPPRPRGRWTFCAGADGKIRSVRRGRLYYCFAEGKIVGNVTPGTVAKTEAPPDE